ncbi:MAG: NAD(P)H-binding protein [Chloroflexota bacterium]|nr:NAD(P)H-binding protein [Chloroflexota bacterium]
MARDAVTGAFGFTGRAIAEQLLAAGQDVVTLSRRPAHPDDPLAARIQVKPLDFSRPADLTAALQGVDTLYNTYWMRFPRGTATFETAVADSTILLAAAREAGVRRVVHVSVVGADPAGATPYVRAKGVLEAAVRASGLEWAIVRPTLTYGPNDILINNLAWALRRLPAYGIPGRGRYPIQPVHVDDVARICLEAGQGPGGQGPGGQVLDAAGPDTLEYRHLVGLVRTALGSRSVVLPMPTSAVLAAAKVLGLLVGDVVLTRHELMELSSGLLTSKEPARGRIRLEDWLGEHASELGRHWASELKRNYSGPSGHQNLV